MEDSSYCITESHTYIVGQNPKYIVFNHERFICQSCGITSLDGVWNVPLKYQSTEKQKKTISFINNRLGMNLKPITKHQCWRDIDKYLSKAKDVCYEPDCTDEYMYMDAGYYC